MRVTMGLGLALSCVCAAAAAADDSPKILPSLEECYKIGDKVPRADCYDEVLGREQYLKGLDEQKQEAALEAGEPAPKRIKPVGGILGELWGLDKHLDETKFDIKQYHSNYIVAYGTNPFNGKPETPTASGEPRIYADQPSTDPKGLEFQISAKAWILGRDDSAFAFWLAYTQRSWWQVLDAPNSRPFRETDFQPEAILAFRPELFGWNNEGRDFAWRLLNIGVVHQSNGQSGNASRSWNRVYAEASFERDWSQENQLALQVRAWVRISEDSTSDDNPGITNYLGYGDLRATYRYGNYQLTAMARGNLRTGKGAGQISFAFPFPWFKEAEARAYPFKFYAQLFSGYGESLLDYNWRQTTIGFGFMLNDRR